MLKNEPAIFDQAVVSSHCIYTFATCTLPTCHCPTSYHNTGNGQLTRRIGACPVVYLYVSSQFCDGHSLLVQQNLHYDLLKIN